jgi:hypothetical protein
MNDVNFKVCKSVHHHTTQINQPTRCNNLSSLLLDAYVHLNMFRTSSRPSSGAQQLRYQPLVLPLERGAAGPTTTNSTTLQQYNQSSCRAPEDGREYARNMLSCT